jgi:ArsR family transcriptional regulator
MNKDYKKTVQIFKALADERGSRSVDMLVGGELCACKILENFHITQPTLSYHMKLLTDCGLVIGRGTGVDEVFFESGYL